MTKITEKLKIKCPKCSYVFYISYDDGILEKTENNIKEQHSGCDGKEFITNRVHVIEVN